MSRNHAGLNRRALDRWARAVKHRAGWRCENCGRAGKVEAHHRTPLDRGGAALDLANGACLCAPCHLLESRRDARRRRVEAMTPAERQWGAMVAELQGSGGSA